MSVGFWILGAGLIGAVACLVYGSSNATDTDDALIRSTAGTFGGFALASDLSGWLVYLAI